MPRKVFWMVTSVIGLLSITLVLWLRPGPVSSPPESDVAAAPSVIAPEPEPQEPPVAARPQIAPVPSEPLAVYSITEDIPVDNFARQSAIVGRVTDRWGKPVSRAVVHANGTGQTNRTDKNGDYFLSHLDPGDYELIATHEDYSDSNPIHAATGSSDAHLLLLPLATIEGRITSARDGRPVTDFYIKPEAPEGSPDLEQTKFKRFRDDDGRFTLDRIKRGTRSVAVGATGFAYAVIAFPAIGAGESRHDLLLRLDAGATLQGRVVDTSGQPVKFARVAGGYPPRGAVSGADGTFTLDSLTAGPIDLTVKHEVYATKFAHTVLGSGTVNRIQITLDTGAVLEGEFTVGGQPYPGDVVVTRTDAKPPKRVGNELIGSEPEFRLKGHADEDGHFRVQNVPEGHYRVEGSVQPKNCGATWSKTIDLTITNSVVPVADFDFAEATASLEGTVYTAPNEPYNRYGSVHAVYDDFTAAGPSHVVINSTISPGGTYSICGPSGDVGVVMILDILGGAGRQFGLSFKLAQGHLRRDIWLNTGLAAQVSFPDRAVPKGSLLMVIDGEHLVREVSESFLKTVTVAGQAPVDARGTSIMGGLAPGKYTVLLVAEPVPDQTGSGAQPRLLASQTVEVIQDQLIEVAMTVPK